DAPWLSFAVGGTVTPALWSMAVCLCGPGRTATAGGGSGGGRGGMDTGSGSNFGDLEAVVPSAPRKVGKESSVRAGSVQSQGTGGDARQQSSAANRTRCRSAALPASRRETSQAALDASATTTVTTSKNSSVRSPGYQWVNVDITNRLSGLCRPGPDRGAVESASARRGAARGNRAEP